MNVSKILVLGGGFAGLWSAVGAARKLAELGPISDGVTVTLVNRDPFHSIRVRNYEADLTSVRVPLDDVLGPIEVVRVEGLVADIDPAGQTVTVMTAEGTRGLAYDRLIFALGSRLVHPDDIPGLLEYAFDVDTYEGASRLNTHLRSLPARPELPGRLTVVVVGGGLTGIETAAEMPGKLRTALALANQTCPFRVILADHQSLVGANMGKFARPIIAEALTKLGVEMQGGIEIGALTHDGIMLRNGEMIPAATVVWCAGMRANPLTTVFGVETDFFGRLAVDQFMRVKGVANVFAAGEAARALVDDQHASIMSCQHSRPMGRFAGHNVVADLFGLPMLPLRIESYVTILDLGPWGAVHTDGWDRHVVSQGESAKRTKQLINGQRIYPPLTRNRADILAAAEPVVQKPPEIGLA